MKESRSLLVLVAATFLSLICSAAEFRNLDFEEANTNDLMPGQEASVDQLLPGWNLFSIDASGCPLTHQRVRFGPLMTGVPYTALRGDRMLEDFPQGEYYVSFERNLPNDLIFKLEQRGTIPVDAKFLIYRNLNSEMQVEIDRMTIQPLNRQGPFPPFGFTDVVTNLVYDVSRFAGQEVTLSFVGPFGIRALTSGFILAHGYIDRIQFIAQVPGLSVERSESQVEVRWHASANDYILQSTELLTADAVWQPVQIAPVTSGERHTVKVNVDAKGRFYRLTLQSAD